MLPAPESSPKRESVSAPWPLMWLSIFMRWPLALNAAVIGPSLSIGKMRANCSNCWRWAGSWRSATSISGLTSTNSVPSRFLSSLETASL